MKQPFHYANGTHAMPGDKVMQPSAKEPVTILALWFDSNDGTDATTTDKKRINLANCMPVKEDE